MTYNWRKAAATGASIFLGIILANIGSGELPATWAFWKHTLWLAASTTLLAEARYIYAWLVAFGNGNDYQPPPSPPLPPGVK